VQGAGTLSTIVVLASTVQVPAGRSLGTRHEYPQVPPQPKRKLPFSMTLPFAVVTLNVGGSGDLPRRRALVG
jgi:hypothetical protein